MKRNIKNEMMIAKNAAISIIVIGIILGLISVVLFVEKDILQIFPRMDIAWIGFSIVAFILCASGAYILSISRKKQGWINSTDEMEVALTAQSSTAGYLVQSSLLGIVFFLLTFMGYLNKVSAFSIIAIILISGIVSWAYRSYLQKHGIE